MLAYMANVSASELQKAASATAVAEEAYRKENTFKNLQALRDAKNLVKSLECKWGWVCFKRRALDEKGLYIFGRGEDTDTVVPLTAEERQWNCKLRRKEERNAAAAATTSSKQQPVTENVEAPHHEALPRSR